MPAKKIWKRGDKVNVNGNNEAVIIGPYSENMVEVRLWQGLRHVGDVCVDVADVSPRSDLYYIPPSGVGEPAKLTALTTAGRRFLTRHCGRGVVSCEGPLKDIRPLLTKAERANLTVGPRKP